MRVVFPGRERNSRNALAYWPATRHVTNSERRPCYRTGSSGAARQGKGVFASFCIWDVY
jgi:hypothetical protein